MNRVQIIEDHGSLLVMSPFDVSFVANIKSLPATDRRWEPTRKAWLINPKHSQMLTEWVQDIYGENISVQMSFAQNNPIMQTLEILYLGACKDRGDGRSAMAYLKDGTWGAVFAESVLREWFDGDVISVVDGSTLYSTLGIHKDASADEIKSGYRRMVKQWHPDVCKEPDAANVFMQIQNAYSLLSDQNKRSRYDAGLLLEATLNSNQRTSTLDVNAYRSPLRCGLVLVEGSASVGRIVASKILAWEDVVNDQGLTLISSWPMGATQPVMDWR